MRILALIVTILSYAFIFIFELIYIGNSTVINNIVITEDIRTACILIFSFIFIIQTIIVVISQILLNKDRKGLSGTLILLFVSLLGGILTYCIPKQDFIEEGPYDKVMYKRVMNKNRTDKSKIFSVDDLDNWECPNCYINNSGSNTCSACGFVIQVENVDPSKIVFKKYDAPKIRCKNCGMEVSSSNLFCPYCNQEID